MSPAQVRFSRPESEQARQRRVQSYEFLQKKQAEEPWVHLHYCGLRVSGGGQAGSVRRFTPPSAPLPPPRGHWLYCRASRTVALSVFLTMLLMKCRRNYLLFVSSSLWYRW